jgi:hypothetical protein
MTVTTINTKTLRLILPSKVLRRVVPVNRG